MVEKKYSDKLRIQVQPSQMSFNNVDSPLEAEFDHALLMKHLPPTSGVTSADRVLLESLGNVLPDGTRECLEATEFVGVYGRVVRGGPSGMVCLQYLYVFDYQAVPPHEADYEPIFVFLDGSRRYVIYDLIHYCTRRLDLNPPGQDGPGLQMVPGWHSFLPDSELLVSDTDKNLEIQPLSDQHLESWWGIQDEESRLKVNEFMRDPFLLESPGHFMSKPDENAQTMCCSFLQIERALNEFDNPRHGIVEGVKRAFSMCVGILALYRLGAFVQLLSELDQVGLIKLSAPLEAIGLGTIPKILRDGFITMTNIGTALFKGFAGRDSPED